jgi:hypothetical protein
MTGIKFSLNSGHLPSNAPPLSAPLNKYLHIAVRGFRRWPSAEIGRREQCSRDCYAIVQEVDLNVGSTDMATEGALPADDLLECFISISVDLSFAANDRKVVGVEKSVSHDPDALSRVVRRHYVVLAVLAAWTVFAAKQCTDRVLNGRHFCFTPSLNHVGLPPI